MNRKNGHCSYISAKPKPTNLTEMVNHFMLGFRYFPDDLNVQVRNRSFRHHAR